MKPQGLIHTFYSDDITVSGNQNLKKLIKPVRRILQYEGFNLKEAKLDQKNYFQRQEVTGLIVNNKSLSIPRENIDALKAIIHNCVMIYDIL